MEGIYIKEKLESGENKIIIASKGQLFKEKNGYNFRLYNGKIITIDGKSNINLGFKETTYELTDINFKTRKDSKLAEIKSSFLFSCLQKYLSERKDRSLRCGEVNSFLISDVYEEIVKRTINPLYIVVLSLVSSLLILKSKTNNLKNYFGFIIFCLGFGIIIFSELSYKFINSNIQFEIISLLLPFIFIILFYIFILIKTKFDLRLL